MMETILVGLILSNVTTVQYDRSFRLALDEIKINDALGPKLLYVNSGSNLTLSCYKINESVIWYRVLNVYSLDGNFIRNDDAYYVRAINDENIMLNDSNWHNLTLYDVNELSSGTYECRSEFGTIVQYELIVSSPNNLNRIYPISSLFDDNIIVKETIYMVNKVKLSCTIDDTDRDYYYGNVVWLAKSSDGQISFISYNGNLVFGKESNHKLNGLDLIVYNTTGLYACYSAVYYPNRYVRLPVYDVKYMT